MRSRFISRNTRRTKQLIRDIAFSATVAFVLVALMFAAIIVEPYFKALFY